MGFEFVCESCGKHLTIPPTLFEKRVKGRVVNVGCKGCGAPVRIDGTMPPPPGSERGSGSGGAPTSSQPPQDPPPVIPKAPRLPADDDALPPVAVASIPPVRSGPPPAPDDVDDAWDGPPSPPPPPAGPKSSEAPAATAVLEAATSEASAEPAAKLSVEAPSPASSESLVEAPSPASSESFDELAALVAALSESPAEPAAKASGEMPAEPTAPASSELPTPALATASAESPDEPPANAPGAFSMPAPSDELGAATMPAPSEEANAESAIATPAPRLIPTPVPSSRPIPTPVPGSRPSSQPPRPHSSVPPPLPGAFLPSPVPSSEPTEADRQRPLRSPPPLPADLSPPSAPAAALPPSSPSQAADSMPPNSADEPDDLEFIASTGPTGEPDEPPPISHVTGPIYVRSPIAKIGRYALFDKFASGGMATVHMGRLDGAGGFSRVVAIKRLLPNLVQSSEFSEMLLNEARLAARVRHPNVVPTLDVVASKGEVLLVLEYVHGEALSALCRSLAKKRGVVPVGVAVSVMQGVLQGLHAVHEATDERGRSLGLVHRDVSPQNVMVGTDGMARVLDFGIVKALQQIEETVPNRLKGKTGYMSPEQIRGERLTRASDIFAAAIVLWELLTLRRFASGKADKDRIDKILSADYARPGSHRLDLARSLDDVVMKALAFNPNDRYGTAREFADALGACSEPATTTTITAWVEALAEKTLLERARLLAQVENWDDGAPEIELSSTPFATERAILDLEDDGSGNANRSPVPGRAPRKTPVPAGVALADAVDADATAPSRRVANAAAARAAAITSVERRPPSALARRLAPDTWLLAASRGMRRENQILGAIVLVVLVVLVVYVLSR